MCVCVCVCGWVAASVQALIGEVLRGATKMPCTRAGDDVSESFCSDFLDEMIVQPCCHAQMPHTCLHVIAPGVRRRFARCGAFPQIVNCVRREKKHARQAVAGCVLLFGDGGSSLKPARPNDVLCSGRHDDACAQHPLPAAR